MTTPATTTSLTPAVIDYLVTACRASTVLGAAFPDPVVVMDGPETTADTLTENRHLWIGGWPGFAGAVGGVTAAADQDFAFADRGRTRTETGDVQCAAHAWGGSTVMKTHRDSCHAIVSAVELLLRGDPVSGGPGDYSMGGLLLWSQVAGPYEWTPRQGDEGAGMLCTFKITYEGRLYTS